MIYDNEKYTGREKGRRRSREKDEGRSTKDEYEKNGTGE